MSQFRPIERQMARQRSQAQAQARPARVRFFAMVTGIGEARLEEDAALHFDTMFLEEPTFYFGTTAAHPLLTGEVPVASATVLSYEQNDRGLYTAASVGFNVASTNETLQLKFSLTFEGHALRMTADVVGANRV